MKLAILAAVAAVSLSVPAAAATVVTADRYLDVNTGRYVEHPAIFIDDGYVTEASAANFFAVIDGQVVTPPNGPKILPGITRDKLIELNLGVAERPIRETELAKATEMFLTSSTKELMWVSRWGDRKVSDSAGPLMRQLHEAYRHLVARATSP